MIVHVALSPETGAEYVAEAITRQLQQKPNSILGLATGRTMEPVYERLRYNYRTGRCSWRKARTFNLDEYVLTGSGQHTSIFQFMQDQLIRHIDLPSEQFHIPNAHAESPRKEAEAYEALLDQHEPIDLQILGIGTNGHIAFNEPGSAKDSRTRIVRLAEETLTQNFGATASRAPRHAITMGLGSIVRARKIILLATGVSKQNAITSLLQHSTFTPTSPASALVHHPNVELILDPAAAAGIARHEHRQPGSASTI
ncbi:MAG: glucosamine-6-phosphate deaminase [Pseudomonadota bacterium]